MQLVVHDLPATEGQRRFAGYVHDKRLYTPLQGSGIEHLPSGRPARHEPVALESDPIPGVFSAMLVKPGLF
jgi:hypothetical protein